jgi:hypothetical protein
MVKANRPVTIIAEKASFQPGSAQFHFIRVEKPLGPLAADVTGNSQRGIAEFFFHRPGRTRPEGGG